MNYSLYQTAEIAESEPLRCYHCGLTVTVPGEFSSIHSQSVRDFCCAGCQAITDIIEQGGFERYYELRQEPGLKPDQHSSDSYAVYDRSDMQHGWLHKNYKNKNNYNTEYEAELLIEGISCAACVWLLESWLEKIPAVSKVNVNLSNSRLSILWSGAELNVSDLFRQIHLIGYRAKPYSQVQQHALLNSQRQSLLKQLGVAAAFGMQIMVISVALYMGDWLGMEDDIESFMTRVSLLLSLPILLYSARPFYQGAIRSLRMRTAGMDVPVSLGLTLAFLGSTWATINGQGDTYFDSVAMFVFFLLGARFLELNARIAGNSAMNNLASVQPEIAYKVSTSLMDSTSTPDTQPVPVSELVIGDRVMVKSGELVPADGFVVGAISSFDESLLTGEHRPVERKSGEQVYAGAINCDQPSIIEINKLADDSMISSILSLANRSNNDKPRISILTEKLAAHFVVAIILIAASVASYGVYVGNNDWLATTIAVLVVTCPCALSLATPLSLSATTNTLMRHGVFIVRQHAIETLSHVNHMIFDKTGTLTEGQLSVSRVEAFSQMNADQCLSIAASLESSSNHPIARAIKAKAGSARGKPVTNMHHIPGAGISGMVDQQRYFLGSPTFIKSEVHQSEGSTAILQLGQYLNETRETVALFASETEILACLVFSDQIRSGAIDTIKYFQQQKIGCEICSGDHSNAVNEVANHLGIQQYHGECLPEDKLEILDEHIRDNKIVAMIGDGINDTPALSKSHLAIAIARDVNLTSANADILLTSSDLSVLSLTEKTSRWTMKIIKQNIIWALVYNASAVPLAVMGYLPPWLAGLGMSLSSIIVVFNASRLNKLKD